MYIPAARERVKVEGRTGVYFVLAVDAEAGVAYVIDTARESGYVDTARFNMLRRHESDSVDVA